MTIYFSQNSDAAAANLSNCEVIGRACSALASDTLTVEQRSAILNRIGADPSDTKRTATISALLKRLKNSDIEIMPTKDTGIFLLADKGENIAIFKPGLKRSRMEIFVRNFASHLGLEDSVVPGTLAVLTDPPALYEKIDGQHREVEEITEDLWSGKLKVFIDEDDDSSDSAGSSGGAPGILLGAFEYESESEEEETEKALFGIVEPFLGAAQGPQNLDEFIPLVTTALAIGLRDADTEEIRSGMLVDVEDVMPYRLDPPADRPEEHPAATHLPFLHSGLSKENLSLEQMGKMYELTRKWDVDSLIRKIADERISIFEQELESAEIGDGGKDHGGYTYEIEELPSHYINGDRERVITADSLVLEPEQLTACRQRLERIRDFFEKFAKDNSKTLFDLVSHVDPHYGSHMKGIDQARAGGFSLEQESALRGGSPKVAYGSVGIHSPLQMSVSLVFPN